MMINLQEEENGRFSITDIDKLELYVLIRSLYQHQTPIAKGFINEFERCINSGNVINQDIKDTIWDYAASCKK